MATSTATPTGTASLTLKINGTEYALWKVPTPPQTPTVTACFELKKRGSPDRYVVSETEHGCECTCGDFTFRRNGLDRDGCKHIKALAVFGLVTNHPAPLREPELEPIRPATVNVIDNYRPATPAVARVAASAPTYDRRSPEQALKLQGTAYGLSLDEQVRGPRLHPFQAIGLGRAPYQVWGDIHLPSPEKAAGDHAARERRETGLARNAALFHVDPRRCNCCGLEVADLYVLTDAANANHAVCRPCLEWTGSASLLRRAAHLDHERDRLEQQHERDRERQISSQTKGQPR